LPTLIPTDHTGLVWEGQDASRAEILAAAREYLTGRGNHHLDVGDALADRPGLVVAAWWVANAGFTGIGHLGAVPVTVVNLPAHLAAGQLDET
jgi:hypothetical protein